MKSKQNKYIPVSSVVKTSLETQYMCTSNTNRYRNILYTRNMSVHRYIGCLHEIEIRIFKQDCNLIGRKK